MAESKLTIVIGAQDKATPTLNKFNQGLGETAKKTDQAMAGFKYRMISRSPLRKSAPRCSWRLRTALNPPLKIWRNWRIDLKLLKVLPRGQPNSRRSLDAIGRFSIPCSLKVAMLFERTRHPFRII